MAYSLGPTFDDVDDRPTSGGWYKSFTHISMNISSFACKKSRREMLQDENGKT